MSNTNVKADLRASIKGPITSPLSTFDYLTVLSMPQVSFEFLQIAFFHGGDTGSIPVRDAKVPAHF